MKKLFRLFVLFIVPFVLLSCETDFNIIADYKEVAIVYGLLNQGDSIHYLRINKAFLGEGNSLTYAKVADSSSFGADIRVVLTAISSQGIKREIVFDTVTLSSKDTGVFYAPNQLFYYSKEILYDDDTCILNITNIKTGLQVSSQTRLIHNFVFTKPSSGAKSISFKRSITSVNKFIWENAVNGKRYQFRMHYNFKELTSSGDTVHRTIDWIFSELVTDKYDGTGSSEVGYQNEDFFTLCENKIPYTDPTIEANVITRYSGLCNLEVTAVGDDFNTYLEASAPSTGVLIEKPVYTNITNGLGLLSCRYQIHKELPLNSETIQDLSTTTDLKFAKPN